MPDHSHSSLSSFENCPRQYRYRYVDRIPRRTTSIEAHMGRSVHTALEALYGAVGKGFVPSVGELERTFLAAWDDMPEGVRVVRGGFETTDYRQLGLHCLQRFYRRHHPFDSEETVAIEEQVEIELSPDGPKLIGYLDRLCRTAPGVYEIHDYKTSASWPRGRDLDFDRQLTLYEIGVRRRYPDAVQIRHVWHYLVFERAFSRVRNTAYCEKVKSACRALIHRIQREQRFPARTGVLCHWCEFQSECPEGRTYLETHTPPGLPVQVR